MTIDSILLPEETLAAESYILRQEIPALQMLAAENGHARWGPLIRLPQGAELQKFGAGFDDKTLLVRFNNCFYIVFEEDLAASQMSGHAKFIRDLRILI